MDAVSPVVLPAGSTNHAPSSETSSAHGVASRSAGQSMHCCTLWVAEARPFRKLNVVLHADTLRGTEDLNDQTRIACTGYPSQPLFERPYEILRISSGCTIVVRYLPCYGAAWPFPARVQQLLTRSAIPKWPRRCLRSGPCLRCAQVPAVPGVLVHSAQLL